MTRIATLTCPTCGVTVASMPEHLALIANRRKLYSSRWDLPEPRTRYTVLDFDDDVVTEPLVKYTRAYPRAESA